ncbi:hypothetical protein BDP27DRAFT_1432336 [Rhodocollybia butyracea]|uniref:DUF6589 domain-containing protein n=1 Tax=Rhodocollybia butyracea TaxID=206335 RepID=A0A9P5TWU0_9AGAR|nr:hypothetical protein BDP27DRAFT_1432336 [Rhodocollybia butyracea]
MSTEYHRNKTGKLKPRRKWLSAADASPVILQPISDASKYSISPASRRYQPYSYSRVQSDSSNVLIQPQNFSSILGSRQNERPSLSITIPQVPAYSSSPETPATLVDSPTSPRFAFPLDSPFITPSISQSTAYHPQHLFSSAFVIPHVEGWRHRSKKLSAEEILKEGLDNVAETLVQISSTFGSIGHQKVVARLLSGRNKVKVAHIIDAIYNHRDAQPSWRSPRVEERKLAFSLTKDLTSIGFACPALKAWAAQICAAEAHRDMKILIQNDPDHPEYAPAVLSLKDISWSEVMDYSPEQVVDTLCKRTVFLFNFFEHISVPHKDGKPVECIRRPHEMCIIASLTPLINGHNMCVNGYFSLAFRIHLFSCQAHTDLKCLASRIGLAVHDATIRRAIKAMTKKARVEMKRIAIEAAANGDVVQGLGIDNIQRHAQVYKGGALQQSIMKTGTYSCEIQFQGVPPGAWDLNDYLTRVIANKRSEMTVDSLWRDIDWNHYNESMVLYCIKMLAEEIHVLSSHVKTVTDRFHSKPMAIHRLPDDFRTSIQPLGSNAENELETQGMKRAIDDFNSQIGYPHDAAETLLEWVGGDSGTHDSIEQILTPEGWHVWSTGINAISENHFGPANSSNPSSLSMLFHAIGLKRPLNLKKVDFYPTTKGCKVVWTLMILDCWRIILNTDDLELYFNDLATEGGLPTFDFLFSTAQTLIWQYVCSAAYHRVLSLEAQDGVRNSTLKAEQVELEKAFQDPEDFDGDCTLANSIAFKMHFGSWLLLEHAIKAGDVGWVMQLLKIWIFMFAGLKHPKYTTYLLELHCLLTYESSDALQMAILNNYLVQFGLEAQECDLMIEHHVFKLEDMVSRAGGEFDGPFYRDIIAPNVDNMTRLNRSLMLPFELGERKNSHTKPNLLPEKKLLMSFLIENEVQFFRPTRTYHRIASESLSDGYTKLGTGGKIASFIEETSRKAKFTEAIQNKKKRTDSNDTDMRSPIPSPVPSPPPSTNKENDDSGSNSESSSSCSSSSSSSSDNGAAITDIQTQPDNSAEEDKDDTSDEDMVGGKSDDEGNWSDQGSE